jgi:hypothetical protein
MLSSVGQRPYLVGTQMDDFWVLDFPNWDSNPFHLVFVSLLSSTEGGHGVAGATAQATPYSART